MIELLEILPVDELAVAIKALMQFFGDLPNLLFDSAVHELEGPISDESHHAVEGQLYLLVHHQLDGVHHVVIFLSQLDVVVYHVFAVELVLCFPLISITFS